MSFTRSGFSGPAGLGFAAIVVGLLVLMGVLIVITRRLQRRIVPNAAARPPGSQTNKGCLLAFGGIFALAGLVACFFFTIQPTLRARQAAAWPTVAGRVVSSHLASQADDPGVTYRIDITYAYAVNGRPLQSNQYDCSGTHTWSGYRAAKQAAVDRHRPGSSVVVHYNPADPADAMLSTAIPPGTFTAALFGLFFFGIGVAVMIGSRFARAPGTPVAARAIPTAAPATDARRARRRNFIGILCFTLFWNGFIAMFYLLGGGTWCLIPFALVGLLLVVFTAYNGLQLFNPLVAVQFAHMPIHPGERCDVTYSLSGNFLALRNLAFFLEGREKVTYRQGTDTRSETHVAWRLPLLDTTRNAEYERGKFAIDLPADVMTTFIAPNNQFTWHLCCRGDIPGRPDIKDDFDVTVLAEGAR